MRVSFYAFGCIWPQAPIKFDLKSLPRNKHSLVTFQFNIRHLERTTAVQNAKRVIIPTRSLFKGGSRWCCHTSHTLDCVKLRNIPHRHFHITNTLSLKLNRKYYRNRRVVCIKHETNKTCRYSTMLFFNFFGK